MKALIGMEYKKLWNGVSIASVAALSILTVLFSVVTLNIQQRALDKDGNIVSGLPAFRALKEAAKDLEGEMDGEYIQNLIEKYNSSYDKAYMDEHRGFLGTGGMTKYIIPNYVINYAYYSIYMSNGNDKIGLDYEFLNTEESFYQKYKEAVMEQLLYVNEENGLFPYSEDQIAILENKVNQIETPFRVAYHTGLANLNVYFNREYPVFFILLAFCLAGIYAKDSTNGIDELVLSARYGRNKDMKARWIAGNLFALTVYVIFVLLLMIVHGSIASLHGLDASAQTIWFECIYNIHAAAALLIIFSGGLAGALVMANIMMLFSIRLRNSKAAVTAGIVMVGLLGRLSVTYSQIRLLNPNQFGTSTLITGFGFVGKIIVPYFVIVYLLSLAYIAALWLAIRLSYKKYNINERA